MNCDDTLFRCFLERTVSGTRERKTVEVRAPWPGTAREIVKRDWEGWRVIGVEADFSR